MKSWMMVVLAAAGFCGNVAMAQGTLGELLDAGAVQLTKQQVTETVTGATLSGPRAQAGSIENTFKADGTYSGSYQGGASARAAARGGGMFGNWSVDEGGKMCLDGTGGDGKPMHTCNYYFRKGDQLYVVASDSDRAAIALKRDVKR